jgi:hypothetical protein
VAGDVKIHEIREGGEVTECCGVPSLSVPSGDLLTEHPEIVTCDLRVPRCPDCKGEAGYLGMRTEPPHFGVGEAAVFMKVDPCAHDFRVRVGIDSMIRLEKVAE